MPPLPLTCVPVLSSTSTSAPTSLLVMLRLPLTLQRASRKQLLAIPAVLLLIFFLSFSSQILFCYIPPGPLLPRQVLCFNALIACLLICYARACSASAGVIYPDFHTRRNTEPGVLIRWCTKCDAPKPRRAHHCSVCNLCVGLVCIDDYI